MSDTQLESINALRRALEALEPDHPARAEVERALALLGQTPNTADGYHPYRFMVDATREPMTLISREYDYVVVNDAFCASVGERLENLLGRKVEEVWGETAFNGTIKFMLDRCLKGEVVSYERWFRYPDSERGYYEVTYYPYANEEGVITHAVVISRDLTAWHQAAESLRWSEERYKSLVEKINDVIFTTDKQGAVTFMGPSVEQLTGFGPDHFMGRHLSESVHNDDADTVLRLLMPSERQRVDDLDLRLRTKWGGHVWVRVSARRMLQANDGLGLAGVITDITESKLSAQALHRSERKYRYIFDNIQDIYFETSPGGRFMEVSPSVANISKYDRKELLGRDSFELFQDKAEQQRFRRVLYSTRRVQDFELKLVDKDGTQHLCSVTAKLVRDDERGGIKIVGSMHDITRIKRAEEDIRRAKVFLDNIIDTAPDPIFVKDESHRWIIVNQAFADLLGRPKEELLRKSVADFFGPEQAERFMEMDDQAFRLGRATHEEEFYDLGGVWHAISSRKAVFEDPGGGGPLLTGIIRDVTEQKRLEEALRLAKESAESLSEAKSRFLANMSHEVRTPLNGVMGMLQLVLMGELEPNQKEYLETAMASSRGLLTVINDILDLSKIEAGRMEIEADEFDVRELVDSVVQAMAQTAREKGVTLSLDLADGVPERLTGGGTRIRQVLFNLVGNALKFTEDGQVGLSGGYIPSHQGRSARLLLCVEDAGIGVADEHMERIFDDFAQADDSYTRRFQGAGLGLAIVRRLVELMGGSVSFMSEEGVGTEVCFTVEVGPAREGKQAQAEDFCCVIAPDNELRRALVVEDNGVNRLLARRFMEKLSLSSQGAGNGVEALDKLEKAAAAGEPFDLVLMDIQMPLMDGLEAVRRIRAHSDSQVASVFVVALTAHAMEGDRERFLSAGMDDYVSKPLDLDDLRAVLSGRGAKR